MFPHLLSVIVPAHNEADGIENTIGVIKGVLESCVDSWEIIVVDDGSSDATYRIIAALSQSDPRLKSIRLSRNFGKEAAILAGLKMSAGRAVVTIDGDLQHPPRLIPEMIEKWRQGAQVVDGVKRRRESDSSIVKFRARMFNALFSRLSGIDVQDSSDFKLLDRIVVDAILDELPERQRFYRGLVDWVGFTHAKIDFDIESRLQGEGKWTFRGLVGLAMTAIISFTSTPLRIVTVLGLVTLVFAVLVGGEALLSWINGEAVSGFATMIMTILIIGSFTMISLGIMGEYIAKIYEETKGRPVFLIAEKAGFDDDARGGKEKDGICPTCGRSNREPSDPAECG